MARNKWITKLKYLSSRTMLWNRKKKLTVFLLLVISSVLLISSFLPENDDDSRHNIKSKSWHHIIGTTYSYSAFWDHRDQPCVRVLTIGPYHEQLSQIHCYVKSYQNAVTKARLTFHVMDIDNHDANHSVVFFLCHPIDGLKPSHVALASIDSTPSEWLIVHSMSPRTDIRNRTALCVRPLFGDYPTDSSQLVEFVAYYVIMGVTHFVFYDYRTSESIKRVLRLLTLNDISMDFLSWDVPPAIEDYTWQCGQVACITDCVYRLASTHEYVAIVDIDEFIVPKQNTTLQNILHSLASVSHYQSASFVFRHSFFCLNYPDHSSGRDLPIPLITQTKSTRKDLSPLSNRGKSIVRPLGVILPGIHRVLLAHEKWQSVVVVDPNIATLHHYRKGVCSFWGRFGYGTVEDFTAFKYRGALLNSLPVRVWLRYHKPYREH